MVLGINCTHTHTHTHNEPSFVTNFDEIRKTDNMYFV